MNRNKFIFIIATFVIIGFIGILLLKIYLKNRQTTKNKKEIQVNVVKEKEKQNVQQPESSQKLLPIPKQPVLFLEIGEQLDKVKYELNTLLNNKIGRDVSSHYLTFINLNPKKVVEIIEINLGYLNPSDFDMSGETMDSSIKRIQYKNKDLFILLGQTGFLDIVGKIISLATWASSSKSLTEENMKHFMLCINKINWKTIDSWSNINSLIKKCL